MKPNTLLSTALGLALLATPALAQRQGSTQGDAQSATLGNRGAADVDRMHRGNGTNGGPAELLRRAQSAMRSGQTVQANELLERAETRLRQASADPARSVGGEPAQHVSEARRALNARDRAEAMRHTNLAIASMGGDSATGSGAGRAGAQGGGAGAVQSGMGTPPPGRGTSASPSDGVVRAQSGSRGGTGLPEGNIPGWSGPGSTRGSAPAEIRGNPITPPQGAALDTAPGSGPRSSGTTTGSFNATPGTGSAGTMGDPARVGGAAPTETGRSPGSSGIGGAIR